MKSKSSFSQHVLIPDEVARLAYVMEQREKARERINAALAESAALTASAGTRPKKTARPPWESNPTFFRELAIARLQQRPVFNGQWIS